jgi:DNA-binding transcriptional LysR family regulator
VNTDLDPQLLRSFVAVAEERHFTRAATRLYLAQQAVSRHVRRLEEQLGVALLTRSTRRVELTAAGERLLPRARRLLALQAEAVAEARGMARPLLIDALGPGLTPVRLLAEARRRDPAAELVARFGGGAGAGLAALRAGGVDVAFGLATDAGDLAARLVRLEPLGLLVPYDHPLAGQGPLPSAALAGLEVDTSAGNPRAPEWTELADGFLRVVGARPAPPHAHADGPEETAAHLHRHGLPILAMTTGQPVPGAVLRPLAGPTPLYPWSMVHGRTLHHPGLAALHAACDHAATAWRWLGRPADAWLPGGDQR